MTDKKKKLTEAQETALRVGLANHGIVEVARGFGRDRNTPHAITGRVYARLVTYKLLTPYQSRAPFKGEALLVQSGKTGYLTVEGEFTALKLRLAGLPLEAQGTVAGWMGGEGVPAAALQEIEAMRGECDDAGCFNGELRVMLDKLMPPAAKA